MKNGTVIFWGFIPGSMDTQFAPDPVEWSYISKEAREGTYEIQLIANLQDGWHLNTKCTPYESLELPTTISFSKNPLIELHGRIRVIESTKTFFIQTVKLVSRRKTVVTGTTQFQACTAQECLPTTVTHFQIALK